ncbi:hypothetical protein FOA52_006902 [Chlamydomonas sp. UWO 241]|nr:hypothetical protein FOA52_006902 [Chlamydomonas sp. UWO 241]
MDLPPHLLAGIICHLSARDRMSCLRVSQQMHEAVVQSCPQLDCTAFQQDHSTASDWVKCINLARGACNTLCSSRSDGARRICSDMRFAQGVRCDMSVRYTRGLGALALATLLPNLRRLCLDERTCPLGGMTNDLARALASKCKQLTVVSVAFAPHSVPGELFNDQGLIVLSEGCPRLASLSLGNCCIADRSLFAVAANCKGLVELRLSGYSERITDVGIQVLTASCSSLHTMWLSSKLCKVTDAGIAGVASLPHLQRLKLTAAATDASLDSLGAHSLSLRVLDARKTTLLTAAGVARVLATWSRLDQGVVVLVPDRCRPLPEELPGGWTLSERCGRRGAGGVLVKAGPMGALCEAW